MLYAMKDFVFINVWNNVGNLIRLLIALLLYMTGHVSILSMVLLLCFTAPLTILVPLIFRYRTLLSSLMHSPIYRHEYRFRFAMTNFAAQQTFNLGMRMDLFILSSFGNKIAVGNYGLAQKIILSIISVVVSITQVLSPEFSTAKTKSDIQKVVRHAALYLLIPTGIFLALALTPDALFRIVFTDKYALTPALARALGLAFALFGLGQIPMLTILYTFKKPIYLLLTNLVYLVTIVGGCYFAIGQWGVWGAPVAVGVALAIPILLQSALAWKKIDEL